MATIHQFKPSFDGRDTGLMYEALDLACARLGTAGRPHNVRRIIAQRILEAMEKGERDPTRLCNIGIAALGPVITDLANQGFTGGAQECLLLPAAIVGPAALSSVSAAARTAS
jgi:hypothetical protein